MTRKRESIDEFTERAIRATEANKLIPPIVYLPKKMRLTPHRLTQDQVRVTVDPPTVLENHARIADADPIGFLIAIMHGQPIPAFHIQRDGSINIEYYVAPPNTRIKVAGFLAHKVTHGGSRSGRNSKAPNPEMEQTGSDWDILVQDRSTNVDNPLSPRNTADDAAGES